MCVRSLLVVLGFVMGSWAVAQDSKPALDEVRVIRCGTLLPVPGGPVMKNATIIARNGVIESVSEGLDVKPAEVAGRKSRVEVVDLSGFHVLPGLIDCHVHLTMEFDRDRRLRMVEETDSLVALRAASFARKTIDAGFTTVRDLGAYRPEAVIALRDAVNQGLVVGPRIIAAAHPIAITGGHGDGTLGFRPDMWGTQTPEDGIADGADECMKAVRAQIKLGADVIKLTATGGVLSASAAGLRQHFTEDELGAIVKAAHSMARKVASHAHGTDGINAALRAGVDSIEHGTYLDDESIRLFQSKGAYLVPTMLAAKTVAENAEKPGFYMAMVAAKAREVGPKIKVAVQKAHGAGVKIAFGTDSGVSAHGDNWREFVLLVDAGLSPTESIVAATVSAADLLGVSKEVGTIEPGKACDLVATAGDPTANVEELSRIAVVMRGGTVLKKGR